MGADTFEARAKGKTAATAFAAAQSYEMDQSGRRGYSGTILEKDSFVMISVPDGVNPFEYANSLIDNADERIDDKWGPAGCIKLTEGEYYFFGWASS